MKHLFDVAQELESLIVSQRWRFCFIGGLALQPPGEVR